MQTFSPFPLRARGLLEIFDASIKLYKQYFWVLLGWSAIVTGAGILGSLIPLAGIAVTFFATPLGVGAAVCCVAAAVRGQSVEFGQCWRFIQPRFWMMVLMTFLVWIIAVVIIGVLVAISAGVIIGGAYLFQSSDFAIQFLMGAVAFFFFGVLATLLSSVFFSWMSLIPIVICMEEDKRSTNSLGRAADILKGNWLRVTALMAIVGLGMLALMIILFGSAALLIGVGEIGDMFQGRSSGTTEMWLGIAAMGLAYLLLAIIFTPLYYLILTVFYLDVRVRREALDLEWTAHASAPATPSGVPEYSAFNFAPTTAATVFADSPSQLSLSKIPAPEIISPAPFQIDDYNAPPNNPFGTRVLSDEPSTPLPPNPEPQAEKFPDSTPRPPDSFQPSTSNEPPASPDIPAQSAPQSPTNW